MSKPTNKQGVVPCARRHHHEQGLTADCRQCGTEFKQYHNAHTFCSQTCSWDYRGQAWETVPCSDCGVDIQVLSSKGKGVCNRCSRLRVNPERTDV